MNKSMIIKEKSSFVEWSLSLKGLSDEVWFEPFYEGSWGIADVISHFISWDKFIIHNRISHLLKGEVFPKVNVDIEKVNKDASNYARSGIRKDCLITEFMNCRKELVHLLDCIPFEQFHQPSPWNETISLADYFDSLIQHDINHKQQIESHIKNKKGMG